MLLALSHVILHLTLCSAMANVPAQTPLVVHVRMTYPPAETAIDKDFTVVREPGNAGTVEFDIDHGVYRTELTAPAYRCRTSDYLDFLPDRPRSIAETLVEGSPPPARPEVLLEGESPLSFGYVKPTFVLFDKSQACNAPVGTPLPSHIVTEYDPLGFYVWMYSDPQTDALASTVVALRLRTPTGLYHYLKLPIEFPRPFAGYPMNEHVRFSDDDIVGVATAKTDTLLCPKVYETQAS